MKQFSLHWEGRDLKLARDRDYTIGRNPGSDIFIADRRLSRDHARIRPNGDVVTIEDLKSSNGTLLNNKLLAEALELKDKDVIVAGPLHITVRVEVIPDPVDPAEPGPTIQEGNKGTACPTCNQMMPLGSKFCPGCGKPTEPPKKDGGACRKCGGKLNAGVMFCPHCGQSIKEFFVQKMEYAEIGPRMVAGIIDCLILGALLLVLAVIPGGLGYILGGEKAFFLLQLLGGIGGGLWLIVAAVVYGYSWGGSGVSPGMKFAGLKVVTLKDRVAPGFGRGVMRLFFFLCFPGWILVLGTRHKQALHDMVIGTYVTK
ncbi:MAG: FHA domain-containing protein [Planctomycetota bacterium]